MQIQCSYIVGNYSNMGTNPDSRPFDISKAALEPHAEQAARFSLPARSREKLAHLNELCNRQLPSVPGALLWEPVVWAVSASSTIEDEGLPNELIEKLIAHTEPGEHVSEELRQRLECHKDIGHAYLGLLRNKSLPLMTPDLIKKTHRLMFERVYSGIAGSYKKKEIVIRWQQRDGKRNEYILFRQR